MDTKKLIVMKKITLASVIVALAQMIEVNAAQKKYISFGWEYRELTPAMILANADKFKETAIDGIALYVNVTNSLGKKLRFVTDGGVWEKEAFKGQLEDFRRIAKTPHLSESFLVGYHAPLRRFSWTDDAAWENLANSMSVLGWLTREAGLKGMNCDLEDYHNQKQYERLPGDPEWDELVKIVRRRGAQTFGAFFRENPNAKVLFYFCLNMDNAYFSAPDVKALMRKKEDLAPAFVDGILDVMPETATLIDGCEHSYWSLFSRADFHIMYTKLRSVCSQLVSPENRAKYLRLTQVSFALYYDMYVNEKGKNIWYFDPIDGSRLETFRRNLFDATRLADEYVWFWGEKNPTIEWRNANIAKRVKNVDTWNKALPGLTEAMLCCKDSDWGLERRLKSLKEKGKLVNLCKNPSCDGDGTKLPYPYLSWHRKSTDQDVKIFLDQSTGCQSAPSLSIKDGIIGRYRSACIQSDIIKGVKFGETYAVVVAVKGECDVGVTRLTENGGVAHFADGVTFINEKPLKDGWREVSGLFVVPPGVSAFRVKASIATKYGENQFWMDDVRVYKIW